jgi:hypothetical protein
MMKPLCLSISLACALLGAALMLAPSAAAQTTPTALTQALEAHMDRPLTPPEAWAAAAAARSHTTDVRRIRDTFTARLASIAKLPPEAVSNLIPPLGRGPQSAMPEDLAPALSKRLGRPLTAEETDALVEANTQRQGALAPHRAALAETLSRLTDLPPSRIEAILPQLGL